MPSNKKAETLTGASFNKVPAPGSFDSVMKATKKSKPGSIDHNMVFVSYLMEREMSEHLEGRQKKHMPKSEAGISDK